MNVRAVYKLSCRPRRRLTGAVLFLLFTSCATSGVSTRETLPLSSGESSLSNAAPAASVVNVTGVQVRMEQQDLVSITVSGDGGLADYASYTVQTPPALVIDLSRARDAISEPVALPSESPVLRVTTMQLQQASEPTLRLMFDLSRLLPYRIELTHDGLQILVSSEVADQKATTQELVSLKRADDSAASPPARKDGGVESVMSAATMMMAESALSPDEPPPQKSSAASAPQASVDSKSEERRRASTKAEAPPAGQPPIGAGSPPPPQKRAAPTNAKDVSRQTPGSPGQEPVPPSSAGVSQTIAATPTTAGAKRLSLDLNKADLDEVLLRIIPEATGLNVVVAHGLKKREEREVTVRLHNVEWRQALDMILRAKGLSYEQDGNLIYVGSKADIQKSKDERAKDIEQAISIQEARRKTEEARRKAGEEREAKRKAEEQERKRIEEEERQYAKEPPCTMVIRVAHMKVSDMRRHLERLKSRRGTIELEETTNTLIVNDVQPVCQRMTALARELDSPPKEPFVTRLLPFNYAKATDLKTHLTALKSKDGSVIVDERSSRIIVKDLPEAVERMETLLKQIDIPTPQVLIEARIVEATRQFSQSLGVQWGGTGVPTKAGATTGVTAFGGSSPSGTSSSSGGGATSGGASSSGTSGLPLRFPNLTPATGNPFPASGGTVPFLGPIPLAVNLPVASPHFALGMTIGSLANRFLVGAQLSAAETQGKIRTLSSPRVATQDNEEAEIKQGTQVPYTTIDSSGRTVVQFQDAFIKLKVKPHITPDGRVSMKVEAERSFPGQRVDFSQGFVFPINTRKATTNIMVQNGSTVVIGGLLQSTEAITTDQVPFFGDIPILGWLFKRRSLGPDERIELLIFLTPSVLQDARL
ncbi:MAG: hypothetical protein C3F12_10385 [Candidatus Methylomirabilota bacterium]|nr:MAG: hypothetical protein C3F12_10385 [candidate division NC10 bacterium]